MSLEVSPDPGDTYALQAWVETTADEIPLRQLLDTGTHRSSVPYVEPFVSRRRHLADGGRGVLGVSAENTVVHINQLRAGDVAARDLGVHLQPEGWPHPALFGMDVLGSYRCDFHFDDRPRIDVDDDHLHPVWFPLTTDPHRTPKIEVRWAQTTVQAIWDTGAGITLVDHSWARRHVEIITVRHESGHGTDLTGAERSHPFGAMASCKIGDLEFDEQTVGLVDFSAVNARLACPIEIIIGLPLIAQASWCMDFPGRRWSVRR